MNKIDVAREQLLAVLAETDHPTDIAISCIGKLLRGEFSGIMRVDHLGDFVESIAEHDHMGRHEALFWMKPILEECATEHGYDSEEPIFEFLHSVKIGNRPDHSGEESNSTKNATLLHDWYCEAIRRASKAENQGITMPTKLADHQ